MPIILCSYCHYIGQGEDYNAQIVDVEIHEETCSERIDDDTENVE